MTLPSNLQPRGTKRNLAQVQSANSSVNQLSNRVEIDSDEDEGQAIRMAELIVSKPPNKKRKLRSKAERSPAQTLLIRQREKRSNEARNGDFKVDPQNSKVAKDQKDKGKGRFLHIPREEPEEESSEVEVIEAPYQPRHAAPVVHESPARMLSPPSNWETVSSNIQGQAVRTVVSEAVGSTTQLAAKTKKFKGPFFLAQSSGTNGNSYESRSLFEPHERAKNLNDESQVVLRQRLSESIFVIRAKERRHRVTTYNEVLRSLLSSAITTYQSPELALLHIIDRYDFPVSSLQTALQGMSLGLYHE